MNTLNKSRCFPQSILSLGCLIVDQGRKGWEVKKGHGGECSPCGFAFERTCLWFRLRHTILYTIYMPIIQQEIVIVFLNDYRCLVICLYVGFYIACLIDRYSAFLVAVFFDKFAHVSNFLN